MQKKEIIWREILFQATEKKNLEFTQKELSKKLGVSLSTVFNALKKPRQAEAIEVTNRYFRIRNLEKFLYLWDSHHNCKKDVIYQTYIKKNAVQIEGEMPPDIIFTAYSAFQKKFKQTPADYDKVYIYTNNLNNLNNLKEVKKRFPFQKGPPNLIVLKSDEHIEGFGPIPPLVQIFVDIWNLPEWYAKDFLKALKEKLKISNS